MGRASLDDLRWGEVERLLEERRSVYPLKLANELDLTPNQMFPILRGLRAEGKVAGPDREGVWRWL